MKIAFIGNFPASLVLPLEALHSRLQGYSHPAPWISALLPKLAQLTGWKMRVLLAQRGIARHCLVQHQDVEYEGIPLWFPDRWHPHTLYRMKTIPVKRALHRYKPDIVHAFGIETGSATIALNSGYPVSCFVQGIVEHLFPYIKFTGTLRRRIQRQIEKDAVRKVGHFVAENDFAKNWVLSHNPSAKVTVIPHALRSEFLNTPCRRDSQYLISVGSLDARKGMDIVLRSFAQVQGREAKLKIVGSGPDEAVLRAMARDLGVGDRVHFTGGVGVEQLIELLSGASMFICASRMDTSPNCVTEAHAMQLPVIATRTGGIPEMVDEGIDGHLVGVDDCNGMASRISALLANRELVEKMGAAGRKKVLLLNEPKAIAAAHVVHFENMYTQLYLKKRVSSAKVL